MVCSCAGADLCAVGHFSILFAVQSMAPHAGRATQGKGDHHGFYGGDAVPTFPSIVKQSSFKKKANEAGNDILSFFFSAPVAVGGRLFGI